MSKQAETWVWDHSETSGNDRLVLLFLADQGDDDGTNAFPSLRRIAEKCRVSVDTAARVIARLEDVAEILVERPEHQGRGWFNRYTLVLGRPIDDVKRAAEKARDLRPFANRDLSVKVAKGSGRGAQLEDLPTNPLTTDPVSDPATSATVADERSSLPKTKGTRIPDEFLVTAEMRAWVIENCPSLDYREHTMRFADYWRAQPGSRGVKADWVATWRNWMRKANDDASRSNGRQNGHRPTTAAERALREFQKGSA